MAAPGFVLVCTTVDSSTHECLTSAWMQAPSLLPAMTIAEAALIAAAYALVWGIAYVIVLAMDVADAV